MRWKRVELTGWGRVSRALSEAARPERIGALKPILDSTSAKGLSIYGGGRSYGDSALNSGGHTCLTGRLDRILSFDETSGVLEVEPGVTFRKLLELLLPRGWLCPVTPGTGFVTVGGALAHDVHGKNHEREGTFGQHVTEFDLLLSDGTIYRINPESQPDIFRATCGGGGLTGIITRISLRMQRVPSAFVEVKEQRIRNLEAFLAAFEAEKSASYSVGWIDALARGRGLGRGILQIAEPATALPRTWKKSGYRRMPFNFPGGAINALSVTAFNELYLRRVPAAGRRRIISYADFLYPLDSIDDWNRLYGRPGFHQFQCVVPYAEAARALRRLLDTVADSRAASALTVLKRLGPGRAGYLSFPMEGYTLALDFPNRRSTAELYHTLVEATLDHGGRVYLAKDALLSRRAFERMYPELPEFRRVLKEVDPHARLQSDMARRLGLKA